MTNLGDERLRRAEQRRRIRAKAINVANRHPLNRCAREMLVEVGESVMCDQLHAIRLMFWRLEADERLEAINWRANRPSWAEREYEVGLMMGSMMECTPLAILRYLTVSVDVWDGCWQRKDYGGKEWTPEALADVLLDELMYKCDYEATHFIDECTWAQWTTARFFACWEGI